MLKQRENQSTERFSIEQLLEQQSKTKFLATIESVKDEPELIKVTPWIRSAGCQCHSAITIPKKTIANVVLTGDTHICCGQSLLVVDINFKEDSTINLTQLFTQLVSNAQPQAVPQATPQTMPHSFAEIFPQAYPQVYPQRYEQYPGYQNEQIRMPYSELPYKYGYNPMFEMRTPRADCLARCDDNYAACQVSCAFSGSQEQFLRCLCACRNRLCGCQRGCGGAGCLPMKCEGGV